MMSDRTPLRHYAVKIVNPDAGKISWFSEFLPGTSIPLCCELIIPVFSFRTAWRHAKQLRRFYPLVEVVAVRV